MFIEHGTELELDYIIFLNGKVYDTSIKDIAISSGIFNLEKEYKPIRFKQGSPSVISAINTSVLGMAIGEEKVIKVYPSNGFGYRNGSLIRTLPRSMVEKAIEDISPGTKISMTFNNQKRTGHIVELNDDNVIIDFNHELADKEFDLKVIIRNIIL
ncbi:hypothetical protein D6777_02075 [Candidatus Woesearchaeota archaeon]|nr:MAG: hypothetical protein D6777_02075 [Candidatus Woesearchaeota archaeon]